MKNVEIITNQMGPVAIDNNYRKNNNWGILFNTIQAPKDFEWGTPLYPLTGDIVEKDEAWIVGESFMCRWADFGKLDYDKSVPFLNFDESTWTANTISTAVDSTNNKVVVTPSMLHDRLERIRPKSDEERRILSEMSVNQGEPVPMEAVPPGATIKIRMPFGNLYNLMAQYPSKQERDRVRMIIKSNLNPMDGIVNGATLLITEQNAAHGIVLKIWEPARRELFPHISPDKYYLVSPTSNYKIEDMAPGQMYQCFFSAGGVGNLTIEEQMEESNVVEVRYRLFKGIEVLAHKSNVGFLMDETLDEVVDSKSYEDKDVLRIPFINPFDANADIDPMYFNFPPIHLDCNTLFNILDLYRGFDWIDINIAPNALHPVLITGVKPNAEFPTIQSVMTPLKAMKGDIR